MSNTRPGGFKEYIGNDAVTRVGVFNEITEHADKLLRDYDCYKSGKDAKGIFAVIEYKRKEDGTMYFRSTLSNPDANGNYQTLTQQYYAADGTTEAETKTWTLAYDAGNDLTSVVEV